MGGMKKRTLIRAIACALIAAGVLYVIYDTRPAPLLGLIDHTLRQGRTGTVPAEALARLKLPTDAQSDVPIRAVVVRANGSDHARSFCVRERQGAIDVLLSDTYSGRGRFYHCSPDGKLISASMIGGEKPTEAEIKQGFEKQIDFWLHWWDKQNENNRGTH